ncbi:MAG: LysM peptidoglycan-binding domain-containing protein [Bacteroidetes bacterium]|nr:MAG: LysM peptidoglycan-binding domain-containing protein [Bacteroidota bacterium]
MESLKSYFFLVALVSLGLSLAAQPTYILFDQNCMERLTYEQTPPNAGQDYVSYHINLRAGEKLILEVGEESQNEQNYVPEPYLSCNTGGLDKTLLSRINSNRAQVFMVYPKNNRTYTVSPIRSAGMYTKQGNIVTYQSPKYQFRFDLEYGVIGENIALNNPGVQLFFEGKLSNECSGSYLFRQLAPSSSYPLIDLVLVPEIGIVEERAGANAQAALTNGLILQKVNGMARDRYLREVCGMEPGARAALTTSRVPTIPTSFSTSSARFNPPVAGNLPPGAIVMGSPASPAPAVPTTAPSISGIPNQIEAKTPVPPTNNSASSASPPAPTTHTVASGETLYRISRKYNVSVADLKQWNNLTSNLIRRGQVLRLVPPGHTTPAPTSPRTSPALAARTGNSFGTTLTGTPVPYEAGQQRITAPDAKIHVVQPGETVASIALTYGYTAKRLRDINNLGPNDYVKVGQPLKVSDCDCPTTSSTTHSANPKTAQPTTPSPPAAVPNSFGSTGGRISPNNFTARTPQSAYVPPVVSPNTQLSPVKNAGGLTPDNKLASPPANVYKTILPTAYDTPPASYDAPTTSARTPAATTMNRLESRSNPMIATEDSNRFGETPVVPADPRPMEYIFTPTSPYPVPVSTPSTMSTFRSPSPASSSPSSYYAPPTAVPDNYEALTARRPGTLAPPTTNQRRVHIVQEGESLYGIAKQYGLTVEQLRRLNQLQASDLIQPYQTLYLE